MKKSLVLAALTAFVVVGSAGMARAETVAVPLPGSAATPAVAATVSTPSVKEAVKTEAAKAVSAKVETGKDAVKENKHVKKVKAVKEHGEKKIEKATSTGETVKDAIDMK